MFVCHGTLLCVCFASGLFRTSFIAKPSQLFSIVVPNMHVDRSPLVATPLQIKPACHPWSDGCCDQLESSFDCAALLVDLAWAPYRIAQWEVNEYEARHASCFDDVLGTAHDDGRYSGLFQMSCNQTHGLVTYRSKRYQDHRVDPILFGPGDNLLSIGMSTALRVLGRDPIKALAHLTNGALVNQCV